MLPLCVVLAGERAVRVGPFQHHHLAAKVGEMAHLALAVEGTEIGSRLTDLRLVRGRVAAAPRQKPPGMSDSAATSTEIHGDYAWAR